MNYQLIDSRIRACDYLSVAQIFLMDNFLLRRPLATADIKPRLLGHWGTCHGINIVYANTCQLSNFQFILGPGHGFPALQANLFIDGDLLKVDKNATLDENGIAYISKQFSWPSGFPSHSSPFSPGVISEGGELGYALATAYGAALSSPEKNIVVLIGDGELETGTALSSLNLVKLVGQKYSKTELKSDSTLKNTHGFVLPILHLNGYKISGPTIYGRKSERELMQLLRGFGYTPLMVNSEAPRDFQTALKESEKYPNPFIVLKTEKGSSGPTEINGLKIAGNYLSHQVPLKDAKTNLDSLKILQDWLKSYDFSLDLLGSVSAYPENPHPSIISTHPESPQPTITTKRPEISHSSIARPPAQKGVHYV